MRPVLLTNEEREGLYLLAVFAAVLTPFIAVMWQVWAVVL
jgi:hypothetical protein